MQDGKQQDKKMTDRKTFFSLHRILMHGGGNRIYGRHIIIHNGKFAECEVLENIQGLCGPRTRTSRCKLVFEGPRGQGLSLLFTLVVHCSD